LAASIRAMLLRRLAFAFLAAAACAGTASAGPLSAVDARQAIAAGALVWDVRATAAPGAVLPSAVWLPAGAALKALARGDVAALASVVSAAGLDLSRDVVVYGRAGDPDAQALEAALAPWAPGRVHWLVGGIDEWQAAGLPTASAPVTRLPVPQHFVVARAAAPGGDAPAAASLRRSETTIALRLADAALTR
jgi:3-mercaptopyruvate sulfurtransferase SseA